MLGGSLCFSLMALVAAELGSGRATPHHKFEPFELVFWRSLFMLMITMCSSLMKGVAPLGPKVTSTRLILIFRGLCGVGFMATYYYSLAVLPMSDAVVLTYTSPVLTALAATVFLGETWHSLDFLGSALCLTGVMMIGKPPILFHLLGLQDEAAELSPLGLLAASTAALCATCVYLIIRILKDRDVHSLVFVNYLALAAVVTSPLLGWAFEESWLRRPNAWALTLLFLLASLASLGETLLAVGLKMETAAKVVFAFFFQGDVLGEAASDSLSQLGALMISAWGVVALAKETWAPEVDEKEEPLLKR